MSNLLILLPSVRGKTKTSPQPPCVTRSGAAQSSSENEQNTNWTLACTEGSSQEVAAHSSTALAVEWTGVWRTVPLRWASGVEIHPEEGSLDGGRFWNDAVGEESVTLLEFSVLPTQHSRHSLCASFALNISVSSTPDATASGPPHCFVRPSHAWCLSCTFQFQSSTGSLPSAHDHAQVSAFSLTVLLKEEQCQGPPSGTSNDASPAFVLLGGSAAIKQLSAQSSVTDMSIVLHILCLLLHSIYNFCALVFV